MKIHSDFTLFAGVHFDSSKYVSSPSLGVDRFMLDRIGTEQARATTIVKYQPNSHFLSHSHVGGEEFLVLEGTFKDEFGEFRQGTYVRNPIDSHHAPWVDEDGCTIFVKLLQMAKTNTDERSLYATIDKANATCLEYGSVMELYYNKDTGERVEMCWLNPHQALPLVHGGEELFIVDGTLVTGEGETYEKWGWLRFPAFTPRTSVTSGPNGTQVFRKMGHLTEAALSREHFQINEA